MLNRSDMHEYQNRAVQFIKDQKNCALFLDMGLGKTVSTLTAISDQLDDFAVNRVLIVAPLRVSNTVWPNSCEASNWDHLFHLDIGIATGSQSNRERVLLENHDITVINRENIPWLVQHVKRWAWDMVVIDESSSFKSAKSKRFKALKKVLKHIKSMVHLTGTPAPNGIMDLWAQMYLLDQGQRLGRTQTGFRQRFFVQEGYGGYTYRQKEGAADTVHELIADLALSMSAEDYLELPDRIDLIETVTLPAPVMKQYKELEKEFILSLEATDIEAPSAGVLAGKLLQFANGNLYDSEKTAHEIHSCKLDTLKEIVEDNPTENLLVAYNYKSDLACIQKAFPDAVLLSKSGEEVEQWNRGEIKMLLCHPASAGHGLNLQHGGSMIIWYGLNWSLELYQQFNGRLHRQGQQKPVRIVHIVADKTIDQRVMSALASKAENQKAMLDYIKNEMLVDT